MTKLVLDATLREKLHDLEDEIELCDETGRTVGFFLPPDVRHKLQYAWARGLFRDEDLARARAEPGGLSTEEAIAYLENVARSAGHAP